MSIIPGTDITTIYGRCGPGLLGNIRCPACRKRIKETGEDTYCANLYPVAQTRSVPEAPVLDDELGEPGEGPSL